jgi:hypothetical protein
MKKLNICHFCAINDGPGFDESVDVCNKNRCPRPGEPRHEAYLKHREEFKTWLKTQEKH